jgi:hypothetical protein
MWARVVCLIGIVCGFVSCGRAEDYLAATTYGERLPGATEQVGLWWASSGWKVGQDRALPQGKGDAILIRAAKNEAEAAQLRKQACGGLKDSSWRRER